MNPIDVARSLLDLIEDQIAFRDQQQWPEFDEIVLIGHSMGALLARKVYLLAGPESAEARFEGYLAGPLATERRWFRKVTRIILFAGMNRGWTLNHHLHFFRFIAWWMLFLAADTLIAFAGDEKPLSVMHIAEAPLFSLSFVCSGLRWNGRTGSCRNKPKTARRRRRGSRLLFRCSVPSMTKWLLLTTSTCRQDEISYTSTSQPQVTRT